MTPIELGMICLGIVVLIFALVTASRPRDNHNTAATAITTLAPRPAERQDVMASDNIGAIRGALEMPAPLAGSRVSGFLSGRTPGGGTYFQRYSSDPLVVSQGVHVIQMPPPEVHVVPAPAPVVAHGQPAIVHHVPAPAPVIAQAPQPGQAQGRGGRQQAQQNQPAAPQGNQPNNP